MQSQIIFPVTSLFADALNVFHPGGSNGPAHWFCPGARGDARRLQHHLHHAPHPAA